MGKFVITAFVAFASVSPALAAPGDASRGRQDFRACAPCHSLEPDRNMTGPSLANLWGRKAGGLSSFDRYSDALKSSGIIWDDRALDGWLTDPQRMVPGNDMPFEGIKDARVRADLLAFLKETTKPGAAPERAAQAQMNGMRGMAGGGGDPNLKTVAPDKQVKAITYCRDSYRVTTADGKTRAFWEHNLRFMRLQREGAGERRTGNHAGRDDGRQGCGDFRRTGGNHRDDRTTMLSRARKSGCFQLRAIVSANTTSISVPECVPVLIWKWARLASTSALVSERLTPDPSKA